MAVVLAGGLLLHPDNPEIPRVRAALSLANPEYVNWLKRQKGGKAYGYPPPATIDPLVVMDGGPWAGGVVVPRYANVGIEPTADRTSCPTAERLTFLGEARGHQKPAIEAMVTAGFGLLLGGCGVGKTAMGNAIIAHHDTPALVLVHTRDLADQWVDEIKVFLGIDAVLVGYGKKGLGEGARVVVASLQTIARWSWWEIHTWGKQFGVAIFDECHHVPAMSFLRVLSGLPAKHRYGLTATPDRPDGLGPWLRWAIGPVRHQVPQEEMQRIGRVMVPQIEALAMPRIDMDDIGGPDDKHKRDRRLADSPERNARIVSRAVELVREGRKILMLVRLVDHAVTLADAFIAQGLAAVALVGQVKVLRKADRKEAIRMMKAGEWDVVVATSLADEGLDAPVLDTAFLVHPDGSVDKVEQRIGRVTRPKDGKVAPLVVDCVDSWGPYQGYSKRRQRLYRKRGWIT